MSIAIAPAALHHLAEIVRIERETFPDPWSEALLARKMEDLTTIFCVAEQGRCVLGYAILQRIDPEAEVINIAVAKDARRQGIGHRLLEALLADAKEQGIEAIHLEVRAGNTAAIALYKSQGFQPIGLRKNYYQTPREDAILMVCQIPQEGTNA